MLVDAAGSASIRRLGEDRGKGRVHFGGLVIFLLAIPCAGLRNRQDAALCLGLWLPAMPVGCYRQQAVGSPTVWY